MSPAILQLLGVIGAVTGAAGALLGLYTRLTFNELRRRIETLEKRMDELPDKYARRDDVSSGFAAMREDLGKVFDELRRANEGIAALRGEKGTE